MFDIYFLSPCRFIHPAGLSPEHTISIAFRVLQETPREPFALWQLTDNDFQPKMGVVLDRELPFCISKTARSFLIPFVPYYVIRCCFVIRASRPTRKINLQDTY